MVLLYKKIIKHFTGGGTGFIGSNLRELLLRENYKVTVISRVKTGEKHIISWVGNI